MMRTNQQSQIRHYGISKPCPYCTHLARSNYQPNCDRCDSTGLVSLITYERYFSEKYDRPIDLSLCRIPPMIKELRQRRENGELDDFCPF